MFFRAFLPLTRHHSEGLCAPLAYCVAIDSLAHPPAFLLLARSEKSSNGLSFSPRPNLFFPEDPLGKIPAPTTKVPFPTALCFIHCVI